MGDDFSEHQHAEYAALAAFMHQISSYRFTLAGLYLAAVGLLSNDGLDRPESILMLWLSAALWLLELRNRSLIFSLGERAQVLEPEWYRSSSNAPAAYIHRMLPRHPGTPKGQEKRIFFGFWTPP